MTVVIADEEVKNSQEIRAALSSQTVAMLRHYISRYRKLHGSEEARWLFPRRDGTPWTTSQACETLKDLVGRHVGADATPHLMRALAGKILLDARPGAYAEVQQLLGHKRLETTFTFYARIDPIKVREAYQDQVIARRGS